MTAARTLTKVPKNTESVPSTPYACPPDYPEPALRMATPLRARLSHETLLKTPSVPCQTQARTPSFLNWLGDMPNSLW